MTPTLSTPRLILEPYVRSDEDGFVELFADERVSRWVGDGPSPEAEDRAVFGRIFSAVYAENRFDVWAVRRDGRLVGHAEIKPTETSGGHEIVYVLAHDVWGQGLGTELASALTGYGFETLELDEIHATVAPENTASLAVLAKVGFRHARDIVEPDGVVRLLTCASSAFTPAVAS